jgi:predicted branched-subunit amino acid permease
MTQATLLHGAKRGALDALGIPLIVLLGGMTGYGALAHDSGIGLGLATLATVLVWGLPGQIAMLELENAGADLLAITIAVGMANMRFFPMSVALLPTFGRHAGGIIGRMFQSQIMSASSWAFIMRPTAPVEARARVGYHVAFAAICLTLAVIGTTAGYYGAASLPRPLALAFPASAAGRYPAARGAGGDRDRDRGRPAGQPVPAGFRSDRDRRDRWHGRVPCLDAGQDGA